jgi:hypothetical protein
MIRPTMSHAANKKHLNEPIIDYVNYLESVVDELEKENVKLKLEIINQRWI